MSNTSIIAKANYIEIWPTYKKLYYSTWLYQLKAVSLVTSKQVRGSFAVELFHNYKDDEINNKWSNDEFVADDNDDLCTWMHSWVVIEVITKIQE